MNFMEIQPQYYKTNLLNDSTIFLLHFIHFHNKLVDYPRQIRYLFIGEGALNSIEWSG